jgi:flagellar biosynthetic protein FlhB
MSEEKELPASGRRRNELRNQGQVIRSVDISNTALLAAGLFGLLAIGQGLAKSLGYIMWSSFSAVGATPRFQEPVSNFFSQTFQLPFILMVGGFFGLILLASIVSQLFQVGFLVTSEPLNLRPEVMNPVEGLGRLFSIRRTVQLVLMLVKLALISAFVYSAIRELMQEAIFYRMVNIQELAQFIVHTAWSIGWRVILALGIIATIDYLYQRWQFEKDNSMSFQEVKDEFRQTEGSPEVKTRLRTMMRKRSIRRMLEDMQDSTIVITNPTHYAVALRYHKGKMPAPVVVAKGMRLIALRIRARAEELGIPIVENKPLARGLHKHGKVGDPIPIMYYQAVATILVQLLRHGFVQRNQETAE